MTRRYDDRRHHRLLPDISGDEVALSEIGWFCRLGYFGLTIRPCDTGNAKHFGYGAVTPMGPVTDM